MPGMATGGSAHAGGPMAMPRVSLGAGGMLPQWLAVAWVAVLLIVLVAHCGPLMTAPGRHRVWHGLHLAMAITMSLMYASSSILAITIAGVAWTAVFALGAVLAAGMLAHEFSGRSISLLWPLAILELVTMAYMLRSGRPVAGISWLLVAGLIAQAALWTTPTGGRLAERAHLGPAGTGSVLSVRYRVLRLALMLTAASMAYMLVAMQVAA